MTVGVVGVCVHVLRWLRSEENTDIHCHFGGENLNFQLLLAADSISSTGFSQPKFFLFRQPNYCFFSVNFVPAKIYFCQRFYPFSLAKLLFGNQQNY